MSKFCLLLCAAALAALPAISGAACARADLSGTWQLYTLYGSPMRCTLAMPSSGNAVSSSSSCWLPGRMTTRLAGNLFIDAKCHVTGGIKIGGIGRSVDGFINPGKTVISGMAWNSGNVYQGDVFSGVKQ